MRELLIAQHVFTVTIGEVKYFTSLDLMAGRVPHELPGGDPSDEFRTLRTAFRVSLWTNSAGRDQTSSDCVPGESVDGLHQDGFRLWTCSIGRDPPSSDGDSSGPMDGLHQDGFRLRRVELVRQAGDAGGAGLRRGLAAELERDSGIYPWF